MTRLQFAAGISETLRGADGFRRYCQAYWQGGRCHYLVKVVLPDRDVLLESRTRFPDGFPTLTQAITAAKAAPLTCGCVGGAEPGQPCPKCALDERGLK